MHPNKEEAGLWLHAWHQLHAMQKPALTLADIDRFIDRLPPRKEHETLAEWLGRNPAPLASVVDIHSVKPTTSRQEVVADFIRLAASTDESLSLPDRPLETNDFSLTIKKHESLLILTVQTIGLALYEFANKELEILGRNGEVIAKTYLNYKGWGQTVVLDNEAHRRALQHPQLRNIE